ncbi:MAG: maleate cis-trans isomerase family protein [Cyclobacteriaceae bacterium]
MRLTIKIIFCLFIGFGATAQNKGTVAKSEVNHTTIMKAESRTITGGLSGKTIHLPDVNSSSTGTIVPARFHKDGKPLGDLMRETTGPFPNGRSFKRKFGLLIPATNTTMEHELWSLIFKNEKNGLAGVGLHVSNIITPKVHVTTESDLAIFKNQFIAGLKSAIEISALAQPEYLIMGMSLEHILYGLDDIRSLMNQIESQSPYAWATWHDAADAALKKYKAKRIGLISPFIPKGNDNAIKMFEDMGYEVVTTFGFSCGDLNDIAHIPDSAKEEVILKFLATPENKLDAVVQMGTNMSMNNVIEKLEPKIGIPILGINAVTFWYALRENGFTSPLLGGGRLLREF